MLASGASESEIFIWDLNRIQTPMTPGAKSQPVDDVRCIAWNRQVIQKQLTYYNCMEKYSDRHHYAFITKLEKYVMRD